MRSSRVLFALCSIVVLGLVAAPLAGAQGTFNERTFLTFNTPVSLPGKTLPAGKYTFRLADVAGNRHIVQVLNEDESQMLATMLTIPNERLEVTGETVIQFKETPEDMAPAIKAWFYPGDRIGHEFVYPREQAARIAEASGETVLATEGDLADAEAMRDADVVRVGPDGSEQALEEEAEEARATTRDEPARAEEAARAGEPVDRPMTADPQEPADAGARQELPQTSSLSPLFGLLGILSLVGAVSLRALRRRLK